MQLFKNKTPAPGATKVRALRGVRKEDYDSLPDEVKGIHDDNDEFKGAYSMILQGKEYVDGRNFVLFDKGAKKKYSKIITCEACGNLAIMYSRNMCRNCVSKAHRFETHYNTEDKKESYNQKKHAKEALILTKQIKAEASIYPYNFLSDILMAFVTPHGVYSIKSVKNCDPELTKKLEVTPDMIAGIDYVLSSFSEKNQKIFNTFYKSNPHLSLRKAGKEIGITAERVRQALIRIQRISRRPENIYYILNGYEAEKKRIEDENAEKAKKKKLYEETNTRWKAVPVENLQLSNRALHVLLRSNLPTAGDAYMALKNGDLKRIRNCGDKTSHEIVEKVLALAEAE